MRRPILVLAAAFAAVASAVAFTAQGSRSTTDAPRPATDTRAIASTTIFPGDSARTPSTPEPSTRPSLFAPVPVPPPPATRPEPIEGNPYWVTRNFENELALFFGARPDVLFLGDSITDGMVRGDGNLLWRELYEPLPALNFGVGGARTSHVLWQVEAGQVAAASPKVIVLLVGTNNLHAGESPRDVALGVEKIVNTIGAQLPDTRILLLGLLPRGRSPNDPFRPMIAETNRLLEELDDGSRVTYHAIGHWFLTAEGVLPAELMPDELHPNFMGYLIYTVAIWEKLQELLVEE